MARRADPRAAGLAGISRAVALSLGLALAFATPLLVGVSPPAHAQGENASPVIMPKPNTPFLFFGNREREQRRRALEQERQEEFERVRREAEERAARQVDPKELLAEQGARPEGPHDSYMVIGDVLATQLAEGLVDIHAGDAAIWIDDRAVGASGLVRPDAHDWPQTLRAALEQEDPRIIFVMLGSNDRQPITENGVIYDDLNGAEWQAAYIGRIDALLQVLVSERVPVVWVGLPPVADPDMSQDFSRFNEIYRQRVEAAGLFFVDIWDGFADATGQYTAQGPNVTGEIVALRADDGINFRNQGKRKLAFFADRLRQRLLGTGTGQLSGLTPLEAGGTDRRRVVLTGLAARGGSILSGGPETAIPSPFEINDSRHSLASEIMERKPR